MVLVCSVDEQGGENDELFSCTMVSAVDETPVNDPLETDAVDKQQLATNNKEHDFDLVCQGMSWICKFSAMESSTYQLSSSNVDEPGTTKDLDCTTSNPFHYQNQLDNIGHQLQNETAKRYLGQLSQSIHRLHSNVNLLKIESDQQTQEIHLLRKEIDQLRTRTNEYGNIVEKMQRRNGKLVTKLTKTTEDKKALVRHLKYYVTLIKDFEEEHKELQDINSAFRLHAHEQILNRVRATSTDSLLSDAVQNRDRLGSSSSCKSEPRARLESCDTLSEIINESPKLLEEQSVLFGLSQCQNDPIQTYEFLESLRRRADSASSSLVASTYDESCSSDIQIGPLAFESHGHREVCTELDKVDENRPAGHYTITYPSACKVGIEISAYPLEALLTNTTDSTRFKSRKGLLNDDVLKVDPCEPVAEPRLLLKTTSTSTSTRYQSTPIANDGGKSSNSFSFKGFGFDQFRSPLNDTPSFLDKEQSDYYTPRRAVENTFVVSGYTEVISGLGEQNRPEIGDRIVAIDGHIVDSAWSLDQLNARLNPIPLNTATTQSISITFCHTSRDFKQTFLINEPGSQDSIRESMCHNQHSNADSMDWSKSAGVFNMKLFKKMNGFKSDHTLPIVESNANESSDHSTLKLSRTSGSEVASGKMHPVWDPKNTGLNFGFSLNWNVVRDDAEKACFAEKASVQCPGKETQVQAKSCLLQTEDSALQVTEGVDTLSNLEAATGTTNTPNSSYDNSTTGSNNEKEGTNISADSVDTISTKSLEALNKLQFWKNPGRQNNHAEKNFSFGDFHKNITTTTCSPTIDTARNVTTVGSSEDMIKENRECIQKVEKTENDPTKHFDALHLLHFWKPS